MSRTQFGYMLESRVGGADDALHGRPTVSSDLIQNCMESRKVLKKNASADKITIKGEDCSRGSAFPPAAPGPHTACTLSPLTGSCAELITSSCPAPSAQIFEGKGQVKVTRMKRKLSERASSIGGDEQNLDTPKGLEPDLSASCFVPLRCYEQAPEPNEPTATCGAVVQYASGTRTTAAQGLKNRGMRIIRVSSKQSGVPGVNWNRGGAWTAGWHEGKKQKYKGFPVRHFMNTGKTYSEAEADALRAAIEFRKGLERSGVAKARSEERPRSGVKGVNWNARGKLWEVRLQIGGRLLNGGTFKPGDTTPEEVERARLAAVESRRKLEEKYFVIRQT